MNGTVRTQLNGIQFNNPGGHLHLADLIFLVGAGSGDGVFVSGDTTTRATAFIERVTMNGPAGTFNARGLRLSYAESHVVDSKITNFNYGINSQNSPRTYFERNDVSGNITTGIYMSNTEGCILDSNNASEDGSYEIYLNNVKYCTIKNNTTSNTLNANAYGIYSNTTYYNNFDGNTAGCSNSDNGIYIAGWNNIYSNNKTPGTCQIVIVNQSCNTDGGGNTN